MKAIQTGFGVSATKAIGMLYPKEKRIFEDPYSEKLLPPAYKFWIGLMRSRLMFDMIMKLRERMTPGVIGWMFCRFRYIDDVIKSCLAHNEIDTIVNLGAGMDCRPLYIPGIDQIKYFEVDHPDVIHKKRKKVKKILSKLPEHVTYVPVDFEMQNLEDELGNAGYDLHSTSLFIWEGVTQYISTKATDIILKYISKASNNSKIVFTYIIKSFIEGRNIHKGVKNMYNYVRKKKNPLWIFGIDPEELSDYLSDYSLSLIEDIGSSEVKEKYMQPLNLGLTVFEIERIAFAEIKK